MNSLIDIKALEIGYRLSKSKTVSLLPPVNLQLKRAAITGLIGVNGSGKSTLLRTLAGVLIPLSGEMLFDNFNASHLKLKDRARLISVVLTETIDDPYLKVIDVVAMGRYPYTGFLGKLDKADFEICYHAMESTGIMQLSQRRLNQLSDGEKQKVMIAKALAQDTPLILLDEPAAYLDYPSKIELMLLLKKLTIEQHKTILISSHDLEMLLRTVDDLWLIGRDLPAIQGIPEQLVIDGLISQYFGTDAIFQESGHLSNLGESDSSEGFYVAGDGFRAHWVRHALIRTGRLISYKLSSKNQIIIEGSNFEYRMNGDVVFKTSIFEELLIKLSENEKLFNT